MTAAPTCGIGGCAALATVRYRLLPRRARSLFDAGPYWQNACSGHARNARDQGQVLAAESLNAGEPARIVWRDEEAT